VIADIQLLVVSLSEIIIVTAFKYLYYCLFT
jgi:hypothetical protein